MIPIVSVIIANFNGEKYFEAALKSVLGQTLQEIEVVVVDNCSTDGSYEIVAEMARRDKRLRLFKTEFNSGGPSVPRNEAIQQSKGKWIAVMDNDDMMCPERLQTLVQLAEKDHADIVTDDLCIFSEEGGQARCLVDDVEFWMNPVDYVRSNMFYAQEWALGLLKPVIRADWLRDTRYHPTLHMAEDYDLILRLLLRGARMKVYPEQMYFYRKHRDSISHRLTRAKLLPTLHFSEMLMNENHDAAPELRDALRARHQSIKAAIAFDDLVVAIKDKQVARAIGVGLRHPAAVKLLRLPVLVRLRKWLRPPEFFRLSGYGSLDQRCL